MKHPITRSLMLLAAISAAALVSACQPSCPVCETCPAIEACTHPESVLNDQNPQDNQPMQANPVAAVPAAPTAAAPAAPGAAKVGVKSRSEIDPKFLWKKDRLFADRASLRTALDTIPESIAKVGECKEFPTAQSLQDCLDLYFKVHTEINKTTLYTNMVMDTEPCPEASEDQQRAAALLAQFMEQSQGIRKGLLKLGTETLDKYFAENEGLKPHEAYIRNIMRRADRVLSDDAERVLSLAGDVLWAEIDLNEIHSQSEKVFDSMLSEMSLPVIKDEEGKDVQLTLSNYTKYRRSADRNIRKSAVDGLMTTLQKYEDVYANAYIGQLKNDVLFAKARKYDTALEAYLDKDDIPVEIYQNLIKTINANLEPLHRYVALRKKILKLDSVHLYDMYIPLSEGVDKKYSYDDATALIATALAPLGTEYVDRLKQEMDLEKGSIDLLPHADKTSGAYSCSVYGIDPYILINYQESLDDVSTLAHELGHSMHSIYSAANQPAGSYHYTMFLAEIASTTNESLLNDYLYQHAQTKEEKIDLLVDKLENIRTTIYRQALFAEFEYLTHTAVEKDEAIQAKWLNELYGSLIKRYYGPDYTMDETDKLEWAYIPHFYYKYYVYSYATGLSSALSFANLIEQSPENAAKYIDMLKAGCSKNSIELLKDAGVDLSTPAPIEFALNSFNETLTELEKLLGE